MRFIHQAGLAALLAVLATMTTASAAHAATATATTQPADNAAAFDHSRFDRLMKIAVDADGWVDYTRMVGQRSSLRRYNESLATADLAAMNKDDRLAFLINAYNAFTLQLIGEYWKGGQLKSIMDIPENRRWEHVRWNIGGKKYSLNQIEHELIRGRYDEPRIHFALVCAAYSCPKLRNEAYTGEKLDEQLEDQTKDAHRHVRWFRWEPKRNRVSITKLYDWYAEDFEEAAGSVIEYVAKYVPKVQQKIDTEQTPEVRYLDYDWRLNDKRNKPRS